MTKKFSLHGPKQDAIVFSDSQLTIAATGTQFGKTLSGSLWLKRQIHKYTKEDDNFLVMSPTYKIMQQSVMPYFLDCMRGMGEYNKVDACFKLMTGGMVYFRTETDPDSIVGIPRVKAYWLDEAGKVSLYFWDNVRARAASVGAVGLLTTSPYSRNWLYKDYIKPIEQGKYVPNATVVQAASWENPYHSLSDPIKRKEMRAQMDSRRFDMIFGGEWGQLVGLVYDCWSDSENLIEPFQLPTGTKYYGGVDWGYYPDPFAVKVRAVTPNKVQYGISEFVKTRLTILDIADILKQKMKVYKIEKFFCDPSQPGYIEELNRQGIPAVPSNNDIRRGIDIHYDLIKQRKYKEFIGACPISQDEREMYHYPEEKDLGPDQSSKELLPVDRNNHTMDLDRYLSIMLTQLGEIHTPRVNEDVKKPLHKETLDEHLARIRKKTRMVHTESW